MTEPTALPVQAHSRLCIGVDRAKLRTVHTGGAMAKKVKTEQWQATPEEHDYPAAADFLSPDPPLKMR